jgi:uncharacterized protein (DUF1501 family)
MLSIRSPITRALGSSRRDLLIAGALGVLGCSLADLIRWESAAASDGAAKAKSIILLWLWGGPSHLDTFDLKPKAPAEFRGPYAPVATSVPGTQICELLPGLARRAHQYSLLRSLHCGSNDHGIAGTIGLTGVDAGATSLSGQVLPGRVHPTHGSVVSRILGFDPQMPRFVTLGGHLHQGKRAIQGEGGGSAGSLHDPFRLDYDPANGVRIPQLELLAGVTVDDLAHRRALRQAFHRNARTVDRLPQFDRLDQFSEQAYALLTSRQTREVFNLEGESPALRARYGRNRFGQCCLLARRLIEAGSRFVQVNWSSHVEPVEDTGDGGWDMHDRFFQQYQDRHSWILDHSLSALLDDLSERGMLDETVVIALGEFGRTPKINNKAGRDHWEHCYSGLVAGGGLAAGQVVGESDSRGEYPANRPLAPADVFRTALYQLGIGATQLTEAGLPLLGEPIEELL